MEIRKLTVFRCRPYRFGGKSDCGDDTRRKAGLGAFERVRARVAGTVLPHCAAEVGHGNGGCPAEDGPAATAGADHVEHLTEGERIIVAVIA